ncbi:hypothetical protein [Nocardia sp. CDC160]|uniref:hypothetical protein n=1 Tax=Nocardia sp. CDC160 TaxID=3112166 RepID=UPI002DB8B86B|nr:hypothetical protein [Nocardia sp. CDC160]MEC3919745.1 hypothetical protein [Nocardia sp. CDC160]
MADEAGTPSAKGSAPVNSPAVTVGKLSLTYSEDGVPTLNASGGNAIPGEIMVVDETGQPVAVYTAGAATKARRFQVGGDEYFISPIAP